VTRRTHIRLPVRRLGRAIAPIGDEFVSVEVLGGIVLFAATVTALVWANSPFQDSYAETWSTHLTVGVGSVTITESLQHWVNDGLMAIFFFVVGLEIKRELVHGELRDPRRTALPVLAAVGGMVVPALVYLVLNAGSVGSEGWGIPMATDIAFALGVLALLGSRIPRGLKLFLLTLAIVDDLGAILVIAVFYTESVDGGWLAGSVGVLVVMLVMRRFRLTHPLWYVVPAIAVWACTLESGLHATIAGVALAFLCPTGAFHGRPVIGQLEHLLHPWTSFLIVPLFALANAGVVLSSTGLRESFGSSITWGVILGLVVGKTIGILSAVAIGVRLRLGRLPPGVTPSHIAGMAVLAGIGFTVSLFIAELSFAGGDELQAAKIGVLTASLAAGIVGSAALLARTRTPVP
jgi:NhaA family Na+:H+ antiporter